MEVLNRTFAAFAAIAYLVAALLPCEPPPRVLGAAEHPSDQTFDQTSDHPSEHLSGQADRHDHAGHAAHPHAASHSVGGRSSAAPQHPSPMRAAPGSLFSQALEIKAPCACGCGQTRSIVGGGAARLGAVVPGIAIARFVESKALAPPESVRAGLLEAELPRDPIPI